MQHVEQIDLEDLDNLPDTFIASGIDCDGEERSNTQDHLLVDTEGGWFWWDAADDPGPGILYSLHAVGGLEGVFICRRAPKKVVVLPGNVKPGDLYIPVDGGPCIWNGARWVPVLLSWIENVEEKSQ